MPADRASAPVPPAGGPDAADADHERLVFGADPVRDRWWGRPLAETRWCLELGRLLADPTGSHVGLVFNRKVYRAVADALALPELPED